MFSQTAEYALRAVVWLADQPSAGPFGHARIAAGTQVPATYLAKILQSLARAGIVRSQRGVRGGFCLAHPADRLTVLEASTIAEMLNVPSHPHPLVDTPVGR